MISYVAIRFIVSVLALIGFPFFSPPVADEDHPPFVYINRKGKHSINVMLICDSNCEIIGCSARFPGSVHDAAIWQMSSIRRFLKQNYEDGDQQTHLIGRDSGYPLELWLFTPFGNPNENTPEARFYTELTSVRNVIERINGILKGRFRCLSRHRTLLYHPTRATNIIYTGCVLHNIALNAGLILPEDDIEYRDPVNLFDNNAGGKNEIIMKITYFIFI
ncbi:Putative nuclease HARBI1 [Ooceraea biroi]|uniref:Putative nuclease HARBI1 n=1 Tax=Ooceraea biroi TaxID=2015173 RepID=A0A026WDN5_OOCBI|nr:Putative nuclease HARBI1 [Ooceraea biroi]